MVSSPHGSDNIVNSAKTPPRFPYQFHSEVLSASGIWHAAVLLFLPLIWRNRTTTGIVCRETGFTVTIRDFFGRTVTTRECFWSDVTSVDHEQLRPVEGSDLDILRVYARSNSGDASRWGALKTTETLFEVNSDSFGFHTLKRIFIDMTPQAIHSTS